MLRSTLQSALRSIVRSAIAGAFTVLALGGLRGAGAGEPTTTIVAASVSRPDNPSAWWDFRYGWMYHWSTSTDGFVTPVTIQQSSAAGWASTAQLTVSGYSFSSSLYQPICMSSNALDARGYNVWSSPTWCDGTTNSVWISSQVPLYNGNAYAYAYTTINGRGYIASVSAYTY